jgi:hypothetical protein
MSIIQISKIQIRRGQTAQTGMPQLASGEFGWSVDQQQLYIGNGTVSEGAPAIGNTRLLTEYDSNIFLLSIPNYIYQNTDLGPTVITGQSPNLYVTRFIQNKLDDTVNLRDFGSVGDGTANDTGSIQRAVAHASSKIVKLYFFESSIKRCL